MPTTINLDRELLAKATRLASSAGLAGSVNRTAVIHARLQALIERESAKRPACLGGSQPQLRAPPRRRSPVKA